MKYALVALVIASAASPALAAGWPSPSDIWHRIERIFHPAPSQTPAQVEQTEPLVNDSFTQGTESAAWLQKVISSPRYDNMLRANVSIHKLLETDDRLNFLSQDDAYRMKIINGPTLGFLYNEWSGVNEGYSVGQHTVRVLEQYKVQKKFFDLKSLKLNPSIRNVETLMKWTLAFHDIGKSFAARGHDKHHETHYSDPIASALMITAGFSVDENKVSDALIWSHQILGSYLQGVIAEDTVTGTDDPERAAVVGIRAAIKHANVSKEDFFTLMRLFYVCDAGAYDALRTDPGVFKIDPVTQQLTPARQDVLDHLESLL